MDRPDGGRGHQLPDRRLRQPRGPVRRAEEEAAHRLRRGQAHRLDDDPARRRQRQHADLAAARLGRGDPDLQRLRVRQDLPGHGPAHQAERAPTPRTAPSCWSARSSTTPACTSTTTWRSASPASRTSWTRSAASRSTSRQGHQGQELRRRLQGGQADAERRAGARLRPHPARLRRRATWTAPRTSRSSSSALANQAATPGTVLNPFKLYPTMGAGLDSLIVDKDMSLWDLASTCSGR